MTLKGWLGFYEGSPLHYKEKTAHVLVEKVYDIDFIVSLKGIICSIFTLKVQCVCDSWQHIVAKLD